MKSHCAVALTLAFLMFQMWLPVLLSCNIKLCATFVTKCQIQGHCMCRPEDGSCPCCEACARCLGALWGDCCDCLEMCDPQNYNNTPPTSRSVVEELKKPIPDLFQTMAGDLEANWTTVSFPVAEELSHHGNENLVSFMTQPHHQNVSVSSDNVHTPDSSDKERMCTVIYLEDCMAIHECKRSCDIIGASKYRWFHNACCECIGPECIDIGNKIVRCRKCMS